MQAENLPAVQEPSGAPDTTAALDRIGGAVERVTEVRSAEDLWRLAGEFRDRGHTVIAGGSDTDG